MVRAVLFGAKQQHFRQSVKCRCRNVSTTILERIEFYKRTAAAEGGLTGWRYLVRPSRFSTFAGIKIKLLYEIAACIDMTSTISKSFIHLYIFHWHFHQENRREVYKNLKVGRNIFTIPEDFINSTA